MAIYFPNQVPSTGQRAGEAFGGGISSALSALAQQKMSQLQQRNQMAQVGQALESLGLPSQLSALPESIQQAFVRQHLAQPQQQAAQQLAQQTLSKKEAAWEPFVGKGLAQILASNPKAEAAYIAQYGIPEQSGQAPSSLMQALSPQIQEPMNPQQALMQALQGTALNQEQAIGQMQQQAAPLTKQSLQQQNAQAQTLEPWQILQKRPKGKLQTDLYKQAYAEQKEINKQVHPYTELIDKKGGTLAKASYPVIDRLNKLIDDGKLTKAKAYNQYKLWEQHANKIGGGIGAGLGAIAGGVLGSIMPGIGTLGGAGAGAGAGAGIGSAAGTYLTPKFIGSPADQEFQKLTTTFMNGMKDIFGGKISDREAALFMDSIPSLSQSKKGKKSILNNMKLTLDTWTYKKKIKDQIKKEHGGHYPSNIEELVEERSAPYTDDLARRFVMGITQ